MASSSKLIILVTGANCGIGFSTMQALSLRYLDGTYIIGCRAISPGQQAIQKLRELGVKANLDVVELDVTSDSTIETARNWVREKYGRLDVLVNNAGIALFPSSSSPTAIRENFNTTFNTNITSLYTMTQAFLPLLHLSPAPKVINISSGRASLTRSSDGKLPPTKVKMEDALVGEERGKGEVEFFAANPGYCKTAFNGFRGTKDPLDGAEVVVRL
ncbi:hypothetical protein IFR05_016049, partial [Cadophora sp. M221]